MSTIHGMKSPQHPDRDVVVHLPSGPVTDGPSTLITTLDRAPIGELRSYLRDLALGRR